MKKTLITLVNTGLDEEDKKHLNAVELSYSVFLTNKKLAEVQAYLYGCCGYSMYDVICTRLDSLTAETLNR